MVSYFSVSLANFFILMRLEKVIEEKNYRGNRICNFCFVSVCFLNYILEFAVLFFRVTIRVVIGVAVRNLVLTWELQSIRVQEGSEDGSKCYPLFSWDPVVRYVGISYFDILLSGRVPDVDSRINVQANPDCKVRRVTSLGKGCVSTFQYVPFLPGDWMIGEKT